jgi:hypothetical protein
MGVMGINQRISIPISRNLGKCASKARKLPSAVYWRRFTSYIFESAVQGNGLKNEFMRKSEK